MTQAPLPQDRLREEIEANAGCEERDLSGFDFELLDTDDELTFKDCVVTGTKLKGDALAGSTWIGCRILTSEFVGAALRDARFTRCTFFDAEEKAGGSFRFCAMRDARFTDCNLTLAQFVGCTAYDATFTDCQMRGARLENIEFALEMGRRRINKASFERCVLTDAVMTKLDLSACTFRDCTLVNANLGTSRLSDAVLTGCNLTMAEVTEAEFTGADLRGSDLTGFSLVDVRRYAGMVVSATQQHHLLRSLGIEVHPDG